MKGSINNQNIDSKNPFCLIFNDLDAYIIEESNKNKYLAFAFTKNNKKVLGIYRKLWNEIKNQIQTINDGEPIKYKKDFLKLRFALSDDLSLNKILSIPVLIIVVKTAF